MKTNNIQGLTWWRGLAGSLLLAASIVGGAQAGEKGGSKMVRLNQGIQPTKTQVGEPTAMACEFCKDVTVEVKDSKLTQGAAGRALVTQGSPTKMVTRHECTQCGTQWIITGQGKAKTATAVHSCPNCGHSKNPNKS